MTATDRLLTIYDLRDDYTPKSDRIANSTDRMASGINKVKSLMLGLGAAATVAAGSMAVFGVKSALEFDTATRRLQAFTGSAEEAAKQMEFIRKLAGPSLFETKDLAEAGTLLAAYGLNIQKVLPLADMLASAMGGTGEAVSEVARVFGRLKSGDFGEGFERLRDFGISFDDLKAKGLQFSKSNEFLGTSMQALAGVSSIIEERFGKISKIMQDSPAAKLASAMDALRTAGVKAGNVVIQAFTPAVEKVTEFISFLSDGGFIKSFTEQAIGAGRAIASIFGGEEGVVKMAALAFGYAEQIPHVLAQGFTFVTGLIKGVSEGIVTLLNVPAKIWNGIVSGLEGAINMIRGTVDSVVSSLSRLLGMQPDKKMLPVDFSKAKVKEYANMGDVFGQSFDILTNALGLGDVRQNAELRADEIIKNFGIYQGREKTPFAVDPNAPFLTGNQDPNAQQLQQIATNTARTAENTQKAIDLRKYALGGGERAALGISPVERYGGMRTYNVTGIRDKFTGLLSEVVLQEILNAKRMGLL